MPLLLAATHYLLQSVAAAAGNDAAGDDEGGAPQAGAHAELAAHDTDDHTHGDIHAGHQEEALEALAGHSPPEGQDPVLLGAFSCLHDDQHCTLQLQVAKHHNMQKSD
jgi:hypothetical protein